VSRSIHPYQRSKAVVNATVYKPAGLYIHCRKPNHHLHITRLVCATDSYYLAYTSRQTVPLSLSGIFTNHIPAAAALGRLVNLVSICCSGSLFTNSVDILSCQARLPSYQANLAFRRCRSTLPWRSYRLSNGQLAASDFKYHTAPHPSF